MHTHAPTTHDPPRRRRRSPGYWGADAVAAAQAATAAAAPTAAAIADNGTLRAAPSAGAVGSFSSAFESLGGVSKVAGGFLVDWYSPTAVLAGSLAAVAATHGALMTAPPAAFTAKLWLWAGNGLAQAFAWPALAKVFLAWYPRPETRGKMYALLATSQNAGAAVAPFVMAAVMARWGWEGAVLVPGVVAAVVAGALLLLLRDSPPAPAAGGSSLAPLAAPPPPPAPPAPVSLRDTVAQVFTSTPLWLLATSYFFNTLVRNALTEVPDSLLGAAAMAVPPAARAAAVSAYEAGAAVGGFAAGWVSDRYFGGRRGPVMVLFSFAAAPLPLLLLRLGADAAMDAAARGSAVVAVYAALGCTAFAPHMLNGLAAREWSHPGVQSTAGGFSKAMGQLGGTVAGLPLGMAIDTYGWQPVMTLLAVLSCVAGGVAVPLWNTTPWRAPAPVAVAVVKAERERGGGGGTESPSTPVGTSTHAMELRKRGGGGGGGEKTQ